MKTERDYPRFTVTRKGCAWAAQGHPWIYAQEIMSKSAEPENGSLADAVSENGRYIGTGLYSRESKIGLRLISRNANDRFDEAFWRRRVNYAWSYRRTVMGRDASCCRVIFGEADGFPGLTVDRFSNILVTQTLSVGMERLKDVIFPLLVAVLRESGETIDGIYERNDVAIRALEGLEQGRGWYELPGETHPDSTVTEICENGIYYAVDFENGQKTGFFLDQRENRALVGKYSRGRNVLNLFCYTGGFSVYALGNGAVHVDSVDSSRKAVDMVDRNIALNGFDPSSHTGYCADAIEFLHDVPEDKYDLIIVDPPAFAKHRGALNNALRAYQRLNAAAISKVASGGLVFTFSCSQVVDKEAFALAVFSAAAQTGRSVRILDRLNQPADHAVNIYHPEGEYLKGLLLYVE